MMIKTRWLITLLLAALASHAALAQKVKLATSMGDVVIQLDADKAPKTVANFVQYVKDGHYDGTIFHRVIDNFMIQGGGTTAGHEREADARADRAGKPQRPEPTCAARSRWRAPTSPTRPPRSSSST